MMNAELVNTIHNALWANAQGGPDRYPRDEAERITGVVQAVRDLVASRVVVAPHSADWIPNAGQMYAMLASAHGGAGHFPETGKLHAGLRNIEALMHQHVVVPPADPPTRKALAQVIRQTSIDVVSPISERLSGELADAILAAFPGKLQLRQWPTQAEWKTLLSAAYRDRPGDAPSSDDYVAEKIVAALASLRAAAENR